MDVDSRAHMIQGVDGRVRLTTRTGAVFDAEVVSTTFGPKTLHLRPVGFTLEFEGFRPDTLRLPVSALRSAERAMEPLAAAPDDTALRKALAWPLELPPRTSAAATRRALKALAAATDATAVEAVSDGIACDLGDELAPAVARLAPDARARLLRLAVERGAGRSVLALLAGESEGLDALLALAAATGKLFAVRALLESGADANASCSDAPVSGLRCPLATTRTALHWALAQGHRAVVAALLDGGARLVDAPGLVRAVQESGDVRLFQDLLDRGLDPDLRDEQGHPMLRDLGSNLQSAMLQAAIAAGANVDADYPDGSTLLLNAVDLARFERRHTLFVKDLLDAGADPNRGRLYGRSALSLAEEVPFDPGARHGERWLAGWIRAAGGEAHRDADAPPLPLGEPPAPPPPAWKARIDAGLQRAERYVVEGVTLGVCRSLPDAEWSAASTPAPSWDGLGADVIALVRGKLEYVSGPPAGRGDDYKTTFEYAFEAEVGGERVWLQIADWKARSVHVAVSPPGEAAEAAVAALWELLAVAPLAVYRDRFRYDAYARCRYRSDGTTAFADFPREG